jgi:hypothetical protein
MHKIIHLLIILWVLPYTLFGLLIGIVGLATGAKGQILNGVIEFYGGGIGWLLKLFFWGRGAAALTIGHVILGLNKDYLNSSRNHELVHVRQFERWGIFMGPAYLGCSIFLWLTGKDSYYDNPFEKEAYREK